jgi:hypothetical protein
MLTSRCAHTEAPGRACRRRQQTHSRCTRHRPRRAQLKKSCLAGRQALLQRPKAGMLAPTRCSNPVDSRSTEPRPGPVDAPAGRKPAWRVRGRKFLACTRAHAPAAPTARPFEPPLARGLCNERVLSHNSGRRQPGREHPTHKRTRASPRAAPAARLPCPPVAAPLLRLARLLRAAVVDCEQLELAGAQGRQVRRQAGRGGCLWGGACV